jgi:hypothetical protein
MTPHLVASVLQYGMTVLAWLVLIAGALRYAFECGNFRMRWVVAIRIKTLALLLCVARFLYAAAFTGLQYWLWSGDTFTRALLEVPVGATASKIVKIFPVMYEMPWGYFLFYSWGRFWLYPVFSVGAALAFWWFLCLLAKYRARFFVPGEPDLGLLVGLVVGWPGIVLIVPCTFIIMVMVGVAKRFVLYAQYTTIGWPLMIATAGILLWGDSLLGMLGFGVLRI